jgi:manganese/zinc/iron transport system substrate-binding protein
MTLSTTRSNVIRVLTASLVLILLSPLGTATAQAAAPAEPIVVVTTIAMVADVVREVGGPCVTVTNLMGPGIDPHLYRASAGDVDRLGGAELIAYNGFSLEGQLGTVLGRLGQRIPTLALSERIADRLPGDERLLEGEDAYAGRTDPHLWSAVDLWARGVDVVVEELSRLRPGCAGLVEERGSTYAEQLAALHEWVEASSATVPNAHRIVVTSHDAFGYFGDAYGFDVAGIEGISTESEASIADIRDTAELVLESGVPAIFVETTISPRTIEAVRAAVRDRGADVAIGGELYGDAMGDATTPEGTYIGMIRHNVITVVRALGGEPAPWPEPLADWAGEWGLP